MDFMEDQEAERAYYYPVSGGQPVEWKGPTVWTYDYSRFTLTSLSEVYRYTESAWRRIRCFLWPVVVLKPPNLKTNWRYANDSEVSRLIFVNKTGHRIGGWFLRVVKTGWGRSGGHSALVMVLPIGIEDEFMVLLTADP